MELIWNQCGQPGTGPSAIYVARSQANKFDSYELSGCDGYWYATYIQYRNILTPGPVFNLGWAPTLEMIKNRCQILEDYLGK